MSPPPTAMSLVGSDGSAECLTWRDATPANAAVIAEIYNESIVAGGSSMDDQPKTEREIRKLILEFDDREMILLLDLKREGERARTIGWGIIKRYSDRAGYRFAGETSVYLRRHLMRRGYGTEFKKILIERCRDLGYHHLVARIFANNSLSIDYNKRLGYEMVGIQREIGFKDGVWQDIAVLQLILSDDV